MSGQPFPFLPLPPEAFKEGSFERHEAADAQRYRFLRDQAWGKDGHLALLPADEMDAAIDAAIAAAKETA